MVNNSHTVNPVVYQNPGYDMLADFAPLTLARTSPVIVVVYSSVPANTIGEFVALAKKSPGKLNLGSPLQQSVKWVRERLKA